MQFDTSKPRTRIRWLEQESPPASSRPRGLPRLLGSEWFQKLTLVAATALATFFLGPYLTNKWQNHQQSLKTRSDLVQRIGSAVGKFTGAAQAEAFRTKVDQAGYDRAFADWQVESEAIYTQIEAYVKPKSAVTTWANYAYDMTWVYYLFKRNGAVDPAYALNRVAKYLHRPLNTVDGLFKVSPFLADGRVNPTYESALRELVLQLRLKERAIVSLILH